MATKKKGNITTSPEWAKHLRPIMKKWFWKGERHAEDKLYQTEIEGQYIEAVEELLSEIERWDESNEEQYLFVKFPLILQSGPISQDVGMAVVVDAVLNKSYFSTGATESKYGTKYKYSKS